MRNVFLTLMTWTLTPRAVGLAEIRAPFSIAFLMSILCLGTCAAASANADGARHIVIVLGENVAIQREVATRFETLVAGNVRGDVVVDVEPSPESARARLGQGSVDLVVTVGTSAAQGLRDVALTTPVLHVLIGRSSYDALYGLDKPAASRRAAIVLDQPWDRQLHLVKLLVPGARQLSALVGAGSQAGASALTAAAVKRGMTLRAVSVSDRDDFGDALSEALATTDALCALPDSQILSPANAKWLLYGAFQKRVPVIGFSRAYVTAGALGAVYSTPEQIAKQAAEWVAQYWRGEAALLGAVSPKYFSVAINTSVAHALGLSPGSEEELTRLLAGRDEVELR